MTDAELATSTPNIRLFGAVNENMLGEFFRQQTEVPAEHAVVFELSTNGGDADVGRRIAQEIRLWRKAGRAVYFIGKTYVYSAGTTIMSAFAKEHRFLTSDCELLIHERKMKKDIHLAGALRGCRSTVLDVLAEIDSGQRLERRGFEELTEGTPLNADDVLQKVMAQDWYLTADEAVKIGLVAAVV